MKKLFFSALALALTGCSTVPPPAPGTAYVWASFNSDGITDSGGSGLADRTRSRALTIDDPVRIASVSKLVVALGVMRLVEQGRLDLDRDLSDWLGWPLRNPSFPDRPITLRLLLSHRSSLKDDADYAVPLGRTVRQALADPSAFDPEHPPGTYFRYANLNFPIIASAMERATGERFDRLMARLVLEPLGLDACFNWTTCSDSAVARAVALYAPDGSVIRDDLAGRRPDCPVLAPDGVPCRLETYQPGDNGALFSPQGGLRISVHDLAVLGRLVLNDGWHDGRPFLSQSSLREMLRPHWRFDGENGETDTGFYCSYGLAIQMLPVRKDGCDDDLFSGREMVGHAGDAYGVRSGLWIDTERDQGIAFFATNNGADPPRGRSAYRSIEEYLARKMKR